MTSSSSSSLAAAALLASLTRHAPTTTLFTALTLLLLPLADAAKKNFYALSLPSIGEQIGGVGIFTTWSLCAAFGAQGGSRAAFLGCKHIEAAHNFFANDDPPLAHPLIPDVSMYNHLGSTKKKHDAAAQAHLDHLEHASQLQIYAATC